MRDSHIKVSIKKYLGLDEWVYVNRKLQHSNTESHDPQNFVHKTIILSK